MMTHRFRRLRSALTAALLLVVPALLPAQASGTSSATPVAAPPPMTGAGPNGATLRCRDGSYPPTGAAETACDARGGVLVRFPMRRVPTPRPVTERVVPTSPAAAAVRDTAAPAGFVPWSLRQAQGREAQRNAGPPPNATLLCNDGSYIAADTAAVRCADRGGLKLRIAQRPE